MSEVRPRGYIPEPTVGASFANGFRVFLDDFVPLVVVAFVVVMIGGASRGLVAVEGPTRYGGIAASLLVAGPLEFGMSFVCLRAVRSGVVSFEHLIAVLNRYWPVVFANALMFLAIAIPGVLINSYMNAIVGYGVAPLPVFVAIGFLIFGLLVGYIYSVTRFVPFLLLEDELGSVSAIRESFRLSRKYTFRLLIINAIGFLTTTLGLISILGLIPALIWWNLSLASLYHSISRPPEGWAIEDEEALEAAREAELQEFE
jgi:hypothetical protein